MTFRFQSAKPGFSRSSSAEDFSRIFSLFLVQQLSACQLIGQKYSSDQSSDFYFAILCFFLLNENQPLSDNPHRKSALWPIFSGTFWKENFSSDRNFLQQFLLQGFILSVQKHSLKKKIDFSWLRKFWKQYSFFTLTFFDWPGSKSILVKDERSVGSGFAEGEGRGCIAGFSQKCNNGATNHCQACPRITRICLSSSFYLSILC